MPPCQLSPDALLTPHAANVPFGSRVISLARPAGLSAIHSVCPRKIRCRLQHRGNGLSSSEDEGLVELPPSGVVVIVELDQELMAMLAWAAMRIRVEVIRPAG